MKKLILLLVFMCAIAAQNVQAQYVNIPDVNFRNALKTKYPTCFNASNQLDTVCAGNATNSSLDVINGQISSLEGVRYFKKLTRLYCDSNQLISLPTLPNGLTTLSCSNNQLTSLPTLPSGLIILRCDVNQLTSLPTLPSGLITLNCGNNPLLTSLPTLPNGLTSLDCYTNQLISLPALPNALQSLWCTNNQLTSLPTLPNGLKYLHCNYNQLTSLPALPNALQTLWCNNNQLTNLPTLPNGLQNLWCYNNQLTSLPTLPSSLKTLRCNVNPLLSCLPFLPSGLTTLDVSSTKINCLPNKPSGIASNPLPICNATNNENECPAFARVSGYVFIDENNNGTMGGNEAPREGIKVSIPSKGFYAYTNSDGYYEIAVDSVKAYTVAVTLPNYFTTAQTSQSVIFTAQGQNIEHNFPLQAAQAIKDFSVELTNITPFARPGFPLHFRLAYENVGTIAGNAVVKFLPPSGYEVINTTVNHTLSGDTLVWNFNNIQAGRSRKINIIGRLAAITPLGAVKCFYAAVNHNDVTDVAIADNTTNLCLTTRGSYDPNDKQGPESLTPTQVANGRFLDYTIRFQNTGTDTAFTVVVADTLMNTVQANTLEIISASHNVLTSLKGNIIYFEFLNILLPDSNVNEPMSHGFVKFRMKPKNTLVLGNTIKNKAAIYFDYNAPIITNTVTTTVAIPTGIAEKISNRLEVYPNPLEGEMLTIPNVRGASAKLLTLTGQELRSWTNIAEQISLQNVAAGMYLLEVSHNGQRRTAKVVVK